MLDGLVVLEIGAGSTPAAFAGMLFADYGARVIKIEPPGGDRLRHVHPSAHLVWNRGKDSVVADLRTPDGQEQLCAMAASADVLLEGFAPGVADGWGIGFDALSARNPALVYCTITGFGRVGPYAAIPAYEGVVRAKSGHFQLGAFGFRDGPTYDDAPTACVGAGHQAFAGSLAALTVRETTGRGQLVDVAMVQGLVPLDYFGVALTQHTQRLAAARGDTGGSGNPLSLMLASASRTNLYCPTADGRWVNFTQMLPHQAQALSRAVGIEESIEDERYQRQPFFETLEHAQEWEDQIWDAVRTRTYAEWEPRLLAEADIAFELARTSSEALDHPQIVLNGEEVTIDDPVHGAVRQFGTLARRRGASVGPTRTAPRLGASGAPLPPWHRPDAVGPTPAHPLSGVTIVELGYFYAMPFGVTMAASFGARVIKIEGLTGDPMRNSYLYAEVGGAKTMEGKESLAIDLSSPEGRTIMHRLVAQADVVVNGFRPGVAERHGLGADALLGLAPGLLYLHAAGYGSAGPYAHRAMYAGAASALAGQVVRHAGTWIDPELTMSLPTTIEAQAVVLPRVRAAVDGDANAASAVLSALALGIFHRRRTGAGGWMGTSMIGANVAAYSDDAVTYEDKVPLPVADADMNGLHALYRLYRAASGWVFVAAPNQREWVALASGLGLAELPGDERFATADARRVNDAELVTVLAARLAERGAPEWEADLVPLGVAVVEAFDGSHSLFTISDPVLRETGLVVEVENPIFGPIRRAAPVVQFSETPARVAAGCTVGQHTAAILTELGYSSDEIAGLAERGVVRLAG